MLQIEFYVADLQNHWMHCAVHWTRAVLIFSLRVSRLRVDGWRGEDNQRCWKAASRHLLDLFVEIATKYWSSAVWIFPLRGMEMGWKPNKDPVVEKTLHPFAYWRLQLACECSYLQLWPKASSNHPTAVWIITSIVIMIRSSQCCRIWVKQFDQILLLKNYLKKNFVC